MHWVFLKGVSRRFHNQINRADFVFVDELRTYPDEIDAVFFPAVSENMADL